MASGYGESTTDWHTKRPGILTGYGPRGEQQFKVTLQRLTTLLEAMKHEFPGTKGKEYAMKTVVMPRMAYTGHGANLSDAQIKRLDKVTLAYARKNLRLLAGFLTAPLIYHQLTNHPLQAVYTMKHAWAAYGAT